MQNKIISQNFYQQKTLKVAKKLLGKYLVRKIGHKILIGQIIETEAYCGQNDLACHGSRGRTPRTETLFGEAGYWYIYLIYGMYYCLNVVTEKENYPSAVLIRAVKPIKNINDKTDGPGKLCREFKIDKKINGSPAFIFDSPPFQGGVGVVAGDFQISSATPSGSPLVRGRKLWIEDWNEKIKPSQIKTTPRIGVDYAKEYKNKLWRFILN